MGPGRDGDPGTGPTGIGTSSWTQDGFGNVGTTGAVKANLFTLGKQEWILSPQYDFSSGGPYQIEFDFWCIYMESVQSRAIGI